jgi:competence protein ComGC
MLKINNKLFLLSLILTCGAIAFLLLPLYKVLAADLYILPSSKELNIGDTLNVSVYVDSVDQAMNAASFKISYPSDLLKFISLSKTGTIINLWVQEPKGGDGEVFAEGIVLNPGFTGSRGKILNITFKAIKPGTADLKFISGSVLANDGLGTNILKNMRGGSYIIKEKIVEREEIATQPTIAYLPTPKIFSPTHPDQTKWYNNNNPVFEWKVPEGITEVRVLYGKNPNAIPTVSYSPPISRKELKNIPDGIYYFNVQFIKEGAQSNVARYKFNIDTQPPILEEFSLSLINTNSIAFKIKAKDELSGVDKIEAYLDNNLVLSTSSDTIEDVIKNIEGGSHIFKGVVYDKAGNSAQKEETFAVPTISKEKEIIIHKDYTLYFMFLIILLLLIIIILIIGLVNRRIDNIHKEIKKEKIEMTKENLKKHIKQTLQDLRYDISLLDEDPELNQEEKQLYQETKDILEEAERKIEEKLKDIE